MRFFSWTEVGILLPSLHLLSLLGLPLFLYFSHLPIHPSPPAHPPLPTISTTAAESYLLFLFFHSPQLHSLVVGLSIARLCKQEACALFAVPEAWVAEQGHPYNCTIMGIQDGREGSHKISRDNRGKRHPGKPLSNESRQKPKRLLI